MNTTPSTSPGIHRHSPSTGQSSQMIPLALPGILLLLCVLTGCPGPESNHSADPVAPVSPTCPDTTTILMAGQTLTVRSVPAKTFPLGPSDSGLGQVGSSFWMADSEVTYSLWYSVKTWAEGHGYSFGFPGCEGSGGSAGASPSTGNSEPVTTIDWRDAVVWCNALTEYCNAVGGTSLVCAYYTDPGYTTPLRVSGTQDSRTGSTPGSQDAPYLYSASAGNLDMALCTASGFRLPTGSEWELAARFIRDSDGDGDLRDPGEAYPGTYASGADAGYPAGAISDFDGNGVVRSISDVAWGDGNSGGTTHPVKTRAANPLGLYDLSGNVWEWVFDWQAPGYTTGYATRVLRGGSFQNAAGQLDQQTVSIVGGGRLSAGSWTISGGTVTVNSFGFRVVLTDAGALKVSGLPASLIPLVSVPGGTFHNGTANMTVSSFLIGKTEVTQAQYLAVMGTNPSYFTGMGTRPVETLTWAMAVAFCNALSVQEGLNPVYTIVGSTVTADWTKNGFRLPTEAEWEWAARGGVKTHSYIYSGSNSVGDVAWYGGNSGWTTHPVGGKTANELGLFDMSGNVREMVWDRFGNLPTTPQTNYRGPSSGTSCVLRGGSWYPDATEATVSGRIPFTPGFSTDRDVGFRVVRYP